MQLAYPQNDTRAETLRYLGAGGWQPDAASQVLLQKAEDALRAAATPRGVWKQLPLEAEIRTSVQAQGHYLTGRFSPGYGDCPLTLQQPFAIALDTVRGLGMAVTPENLLTPRKSVTAILGVADHPVTGARAGCGH